MVVHGKGQAAGQCPDIRGGVGLIGGHAAQIVAAHLGPAFHDHAQVVLIPVIAADQVGNGGALGDGAVPVAELPVIKALEAGVGIVVGDGEGVDKAVGRLDGLAQEFVKAVLVDAFAGDGTAEAAQASPAERKLPDVDHPAFAGQGGPEVGDHIPEALVVGGAVGHDDHVLAAGLGLIGQGSLVNGFPTHRCGDGRRDKDPVLTAEHQLVKEHAGFLLSLLAEQILHVRREALHHFHAQVKTVFLHIAVGGHVVKVLGGGDLAGKFAGQVHPVRLDELDQPVQLVGGNEGIDRIAEQDQFRIPQDVAHGGKVLLMAFDALAHRQEGESMLRVQRLKIQCRVYGGGILPLGAGVQHKNFHAVSSDCCGRRVLSPTKAGGEARNLMIQSYYRGCRRFPSMRRAGRRGRPAISAGQT